MIRITAVVAHDRSRMLKAHVIALIVFTLGQPAFGQTEDEDKIDGEYELEEPEIDVQGSIDDAEEQQGFVIDGDLRLGYVFAGEDFQDIAVRDEGYFRSRWRLRSVWGVSDRLRVVARLAGICSTEECEPDFVLQPNIPTVTSLSDGQITIDSLFLQWFRTEKFNVADGRMETKFVARGGVYAKSLDRNDSNNLRINWTDGVHATYRAKNGWNSNLVLQYNSADGASNVKRDPLDFSDSGSRVSTFVAFENVQPNRYLVQRAFDVTYMPSSLNKDGVDGGPVVDYWAIVVRAAARWPARYEGRRLRFSSEVGYAPTTSNKSATNVVGTGDTDGLAWNVTASIMDFVPNHSVGVNYAETGAGWLVSPQYTDNERLIELRYMWRPTERLALDVRGRWRDDLAMRVVEDPDRDRFDFYARVTWSFTAWGSTD